MRNGIGLLHSCTFLQFRLYEKKKICVQFAKFKYAQSKGCSGKKRSYCSNLFDSFHQQNRTFLEGVFNLYGRVSFLGSELYAFQIMEIFLILRLNLLITAGHAKFLSLNSIYTCMMNMLVWWKCTLIAKLNNTGISFQPFQNQIRKRNKSWLIQLGQNDIAP